MSTMNDPAQAHEDEPDVEGHIDNTLQDPYQDKSAQDDEPDVEGHVNVLQDSTMQDSTLQ